MINTAIKKNITEKSAAAIIYNFRGGIMALIGNLASSETFIVERILIFCSFCRAKLKWFKMLRYSRSNTSISLSKRLILAPTGAKRLNCFMNSICLSFIDAY